MRTPPVSAGATIVAALIIAACSDGPTAPEQGSLMVSVVTTGGDQDTNGYRLMVGPDRQQAVRSRDDLKFSDLPAGTYQLSLQEVADNCTVGGVHPLTVIVPSRGAATAAFIVTCDATGIEITTRTTGPDQSADGHLLKYGEASRPVSANGLQLVSRLRPGSYPVSLTVGDNCTVAGGNSAIVTVSNRAVTRVAFDVTCVATSKMIVFERENYIGTGAYFPSIVVASENGFNQISLGPGRGPAWSPDGKKVVHSDASCDFYYAICSGGLLILDVNTGVRTRFAPGDYGFDPAWSPDGNVIVFAKASGPSGQFSTLYLARLDGSPPVALSMPGVQAMNASWSPDGQRLVFECFVVETGRASDYDICAINSDGTGFVELTKDSAADLSPTWSPDGRRIAFSTNRFALGEVSVALITPGSPGIVRLTGGSEPAWLPDGSGLIFSQKDGLFSQKDGLFTVRLDGTNVTRITQGAHRAPAWRP